MNTISLTIYRRRMLIATLLVLSILSQACSPKVLHEARKAAHRIQVTVDAATDSLITLHNSHVINDAKTKQIALALLKVNTANKVLIDHAKAATADTPQTRAQFLTDLQGVIDAVEELKATGILGIHSATGEAAFQATIAALETSIQIIKGVLQ